MKTAQAVDTSRYMPAAEVLNELMASPLPREGKAFLAAASVETLLPGTDGYLRWPYMWSPFRCLFGFQQWTGSLATFPNWPGNAQFDTHAAGVWQDEPATYKDAAAVTGHSSFSPQDQITNNWTIAQAAFMAKGGGDLLATLQASGLGKINEFLSATWPEGCDVNFPARYALAFSLFPEVATHPPPLPPPIPPAPPPPPPGTMDTQTIPLGLQFSFPITGTLHGQAIPVPSDALKSEDTSICRAFVLGSTATLTGLALGRTTVSGADRSIDVSVVAAEPDHLEFDLSQGTFSPMSPSSPSPSAVVRMPMMVCVVMLVLAAIAGLSRLQSEPAPPSQIAVAPLPEPYVDKTFCFGPERRPARSLEECRRLGAVR